MAIANQLNTATTPISVPEGGTGNTTFTAYSILTANTTGAGALQPLASMGTSTQVLTSNGAGAYPTWQAASAPTGTPVTVRVSLTLAQFLAMRATPVQIIAAQGVNTLIVPISILYELNMAGVAFAGGGDTGLAYGNTTSLGGPPIAFMAATNITAPTAGQLVNLPINFFNASGTLANSFAKTSSVNTSVFASNKTAAYTGGTGATVVITVTYVVITTT